MKHQPVTKHLLEVRFQPLPSLLDKRGAITESLLNDFFDTWVVNPTRIDIASATNKNISGYVTFSNYGLISEAPNTTKTFIEKAQELIKNLWTIIPPNRIQRFGLRTFQIYPESRNMDILVRLYKSKLLSLSDKNLASFNGSLTDVGVALNFTSRNGTRTNMNTGPMLKVQAKTIFNDAPLLPEIGIFSDTDFFIENPSQLSSFKQRDFLELVTQGIEKAKSIQTIVTDILDDKNNRPFSSFSSVGYNVPYK